MEFPGNDPFFFACEKGGLYDVRIFVEAFHTGDFISEEGKDIDDFDFTNNV